VRVIYNAVSIPRLHSLGDQPCTEPWLERKEVPVLIGVGRLVEQKDFATLLRAVSLLRDERPVRLLVVGDGVLRSSLVDLAQRLGIYEHIRFAGNVANPYPLIRRADALVASSAWEGFSLAILEALALGVPVVATDCESGPAEILDGGRFGRLAAVGDARSLANAIAETLADGGCPGLGVQRAAEFSEDRFLRSYLDVLGVDAS
jgi:glycosyltransferase involved in cell wall biosynthesis